MLLKLSLIIFSLAAFPTDLRAEAEAASDTAPYVVVLGVAQDAGYPQAGDPEKDAWHDPAKQRLVTCLALVDPVSGERWLFEATPDFKMQLHRLDDLAPSQQRPGLSGIFLTHAHMGHYSGLLHLGREALGAQNVPVWAMPRMRSFLRENGPWEQLVNLENITLRDLRDKETVRLNARLSVTPFTVPHRDEYSETVGFQITGPHRSIFFLPDIDKWEQWDESSDKAGRIEERIHAVDRAYLDGTFYRNGEIPGRDMAQIPHPFIEESMRRFATLPDTEKAKIRFLHFNRTNPVLTDSAAKQEIQSAGFEVAEEMERFDL